MDCLTFHLAIISLQGDTYIRLLKLAPPFKLRGSEQSLHAIKSFLSKLISSDLPFIFYNIYFANP